jgi:hypothetical protein
MRHVLRADVLTNWDAGEVAKRRTDRTGRLNEAKDKMRWAAAKREADIRADDKAFRLTSGSMAHMTPLGDDTIGGLPPGDFQRGIELLLKYPPREGWGLSPDKTVGWLRVKIAVIGAILTPAEQEFLDHYDLGSKVKTLIDAAGGTPAILQSPDPLSPSTAWLTEKQSPDLPMQSPPASKLPFALPR